MTEVELLRQILIKDHKMLWVLESRIPGRLCVASVLNKKEDYILVFQNKNEALNSLENGPWLVSKDGARPIKVTFEFLIQQAHQQGSSYNCPCVGYIWMPEQILVKVAK